MYLLAHGRGTQAPYDRKHIDSSQGAIHNMGVNGNPAQSLPQFQVFENSKNPKELENNSAIVASLL